MREKLNTNPLLQAGLIGVLGIAVAFLLITRVMNRGAEPEAPVTPTPTDATAPAPADPAAAAPAADPASSAAAPAATPTPDATGAVPGGAIAADSFAAGPGLPKDVAQAYADNRVVVVLVVRGNASDDQRLERTVEQLRGRTDTALFVVKAAEISKYSRITQGVNVNRTPALIVIEPKRLAEGPLPTATVSYGFRGLASAVQAVNDALYEGPKNLPYNP